jgi:hypothetical protein
MNAQNEPELIGTFSGNSSGIQLVYIDHGLPKIAVETASALELYNLDLTLFETLEFPEADTNSYNRLLITRALFDCDTTNIEYLSAGQAGQDTYSRIYRNDGTIVFDFGELMPMVNISAEENESWVVSDSEGSYMIFSESISSNERSLFRLCGQLPQALPRESNGTVLSGFGIIENTNNLTAYPNPASERIKFEYDLQGHGKAHLHVFDTSGRIVKELMLGRAFDFIYLDISDLEHGTYIARIVTDNGFELSEKFVKVE